MNARDDAGRNSSTRGPTPARGPVPVRETMRTTTPESAPDAPAETGSPAGAPPLEGAFENEHGPWIARSAGVGAYGTGRTGRAKLVAIHFFREEDPETPVREALVPAGAFAHLRAEELRDLFERATPIDLDR